MQIMGPDRFGKGFTETVQEIENQALLNLNRFLRTFQLLDATILSQPGQNPAGQKRQEQSVEKIWPHEEQARLLRRCLVMKVLF